MTTYIMVNDYRTSTSEGFGNTWRAWECDSIAHRNGILKEGLPVADYVLRNADGSEEYPISTAGLRVPTAAERKEAKASPIPADHVRDYRP